VPAFQTPRGLYSLEIVAPIERTADSVVVTLSLDAASGIERIAFQGVLPPDFALANESVILERLTPVIARDFEVIREAALKSIRTAHKLHSLILP
jgi:hypothetical protein